MPVAIVTAPGRTPMVIQAETEEDLFWRVRELAFVPNMARADQKSIRDWIAGQSPPSGWFDTTDDAREFYEAYERELDAKLMRAALSELGLTQSGMCLALGLKDAASDGAPIRKIVNATTNMSGPARRALAYLLKHGPMSAEDEAEILGDLNGGEWRIVKRSDLRRLRAGQS